MSANGQYQTAVAFKSGNSTDCIYVSNNYGNNWKKFNTEGFWTGIAVSSSGQYQFACSNDESSGGSGGLYFSRNYGHIFDRLDGSAKKWYCCAISSGGQFQFAGLAPPLLSSDYNSSSYGVYSTIRNLILGGTGDSLKTFVIDHPCDKNKYLVHACLEGPEAGVYYRGEGKITNNKSTIIKLPYYVDKLASQLTVNLTPIYDSDTMDNGLELETIILKSSRVKNNAFTVYGPTCEFFWTVYGKRNEINVEPLKRLTDIKGTGPYKWI